MRISSRNDVTGFLKRMVVAGDEPQSGPSRVRNPPTRPRMDLSLVLSSLAPMEYMKSPALK